MQAGGVESNPYHWHGRLVHLWSRHWDRRSPEACWRVSSAKSVNFRFSQRPCLITNGEEQSTSGSLICMHAHMHINTRTCAPMCVHTHTHTERQHTTESCLEQLWGCFTECGLDLSLCFVVSWLLWQGGLRPKAVPVHWFKSVTQATCAPGHESVWWEPAVLTRVQTHKRMNWLAVLCHGDHLIPGQILYSCLLLHSLNWCLITELSLSTGW